MSNQISPSAGVTGAPLMARAPIHSYTLLLMLACIPARGAQPVITLHYNERAPYTVTLPDGRLGGIVGTRAVSALDAAGVSYTIQRTPAKRQLQILKDNIRPACMVGWLRTPDRAETGLFSNPLYRDRRPLALARRDNVRLHNNEPFGVLARDRTVTMLLKEGFIYGDLIDSAIRVHHPKVMTTTGEISNMLQMVVHRRADFFITSEEEAESAIAASGLSAEEFQYIYFSDIPTGYERRLWCTASFTPDRMARLNAAIRKLGEQPLRATAIHN